MIEVLPATESDVDVVIDLEGRLFAEDSGVHEPHADVGWPARDGAVDFTELLANPDAVVLLARDGGNDGRAPDGVRRGIRPDEGADPIRRTPVDVRG